MIPSGTTGAIGELAVAIDLMNRGYSVYRAVSQASRHDLIVDTGPKLITIEVRTGRQSKTTGKLYYSVKKKDRSDIYAIFEPTLLEITYLNVKTRAKMTL